MWSYALISLVAVVNAALVKENIHGGECVCTNTAGVNARDAAGTSSHVTEVLASGTCAKINGGILTADGYTWYQLQYAGKLIWVAGNYLDVHDQQSCFADRVHEDAKADFLAELTLMKSIPPHPNIIKMYGSCTAHDPYLMILEFACHGDLKKYLQDQRMERNYANAAFSAYGVRPVTDATTAQLPLGVINQGYTESVNERYVTMSKGGLLTSRTLLSFALQIGHGLEHLADTKIVHRDVAARNILLFEHNVVKISDFGLARRGLLPVRWMSPESLFYNQYSQASDVWSYGVFLWELVTLGSTPYPGLDTNQVLDKIKDGELLTCPPHTSDVINDLMLSCWTSDFSKRPTFSEVCAKLDKLLEAQVEYVDLDQMDDHEYSTLND
uniref:Protein kinase domain-containing protein n=2 Tax=Biomphalaria glabrata TaxID=6526 RepID=A0A2C9LLZ4_BIOGL